MWLDRGAVSYSQMGGEGAQWLGRAPFTDVPHYVQNVGDGTFFHSGSLAVRAAVSAGATMTFKILYNGVVAMTGGQDPAGQLDVPRLCQAMAAEGVARIIVVAEDPSKYGRRSGLPAGTRVWGRDRLAEAERDAGRGARRDRARLRPGLRGGTAPAAQARPGPGAHPAGGHQRGGLRGLRRLRGEEQLPVGPAGGHRAWPQDADRPVLLQHRLQLPGRRLPLVRDRAGPRRPSADKPRPLPDLPADLPEPAGKATVPAAGGYSLVATGIGGTGVVMLNQVLATAAFLEGLGVTGLDQTGLSQKAGPVVSHLRLWRGDQDPADGPRNAHVAHPAASNAVGEESADLLLALDVLVAAEPRHLSRLRPDRTVTVASTSLVPTAGMVRGATGAPDLVPLLAALRELTKPGSFTEVDTVALATALFGDAIAANLIALGAAYQAGAVPLEAASIARAIELNGVAVDRNQAAFLAGRLAVHDPGRLPSARRAGELRRARPPGR